MPPYKQLTELPCNATLFELYIDSTDVTGRQLAYGIASYLWLYASRDSDASQKQLFKLLQILMVEFNCSYIS